MHKISQIPPSTMHKISLLDILATLARDAHIAEKDPMRFSILLLLTAFCAHAAVTAPPLPDAKPGKVQGLTLTIEAGGKSDTRGARLVALHVAAGQPVSPFLPPGPFAARWEGEITSPLRAEYTFAADVRGAFKLTVNGTLVLEGGGDSTVQTMNKLIQLSKGGNKFVAEFASDNTEEASILLKWWAKDFPAEPVPPTSFQHDPSAKPLREGERVREGRMLFAQMRCSQCHDGTGMLPEKGSGMAELAQSAPMLGAYGEKFRENFLAHWINDPHAIRPGSLMPRVFADGPKDQVDQRAADLAAYFASLGKGDDTAPAAENAPLGGALFANFGCIACHTTPDFEGDDEHKRVPLGHVKAKWYPKALREFLKDPAKEFPHSRMPNFRLTDEEAERLTSYLLENAKREFPAAPKGDAAKGAQSLVSAGCISCHAGAPAMGTPKLAETLAGGWSKGCMAPDSAARGKAPDFAFTPGQRGALLAFAAAGFDSLKRDVPAEYAARAVSNLRCTACHSHDGQQSVWSQLEGDMMALQSGAPNSDEVEGAPRPTTALPALTWLGEKLHPAWMEPFIAGKPADKPRTWIIARMPGFGTWAGGLGQGLAQQHGLPPADPPVKVDPERVKIGEKLVGEGGGFNCTQCHAIGARQATAVFEAPGPNLFHTRARIRADFFARWVLAPLRVDPETKMPKFADDEGRTPLGDVLEGKAADQFDAIWQYLHTLK
jgi:cytochrome c2